MKKALKVILISIVCLCLLVIIGGYIALTQIDFNNYKTMISKSVFDATGRELVVGNIKVKPSFSPVIEISDVTFANAKWSKNPNMVSAKTIDLSVSVIPLLSKKFVISSFKINDAVVNLEENAENGANWEFGASKEVENKEEKTSFSFEFIKSANAGELSEPKDVGMLSDLVIKEVALNNVQINYFDKSGKKQSYNIKNFNLDENSDSNIDLNFNVNDGEYKGKGVLGALKLLEAKDGYPVELDVSVMGIDVLTKVKLFDIMGNLQFNGDAKIAKFLGKNSGFNESLDVAFKGSLKDVVLKIRELKIAGNIIEGEVEAILENVVPLVKAEIRSANIDIASFEKKEKTAFLVEFIKSANATSLAPNIVVPYNDFYKVNVDGLIKIGKVSNNGAVLVSDLEVKTLLNNGVANINFVNGKIATGDIGGNISLDAKTHGLKVDVDVAKVDLLKLMSALGANSDNFSFIDGGVTDLYLDLTSNGDTYSSLVEGLDGNMALIIDKSKLHLGNIGMLKGNIISQLINTLNLTKGNDELNMSCAVVRAEFKDKKAKFPNGIVVNADKFTIVADGNINLKNDKLNISVKPFAGKLTDTNIAKALSSLVKLTGTVQNPKIGVDGANAIKTIVGVTTAGPVYLGAQMLLESDGSPCYSALVGTGYENRFPEPKNVVSTTTDDVGKILDDSVGSVKETTKGLLNLLSGGLTVKKSN